MKIIFIKAKSIVSVALKCEIKRIMMKGPGRQWKHKRTDFTSADLTATAPSLPREEKKFKEDFISEPSSLRSEHRVLSY